MLKYRLLICLAAILVVVLIFSLIPQGGEIYTPDFLFGYDMYVQPSYVVSEETAAQRWKVTEKDLEKEIYNLCRKMDTYQPKDAIDVLLGFAPDGLQTDHVIYLKAGKYCYIIRPMEWENWINAQEVVAAEMLGEPVLAVNRFSLESWDENTDLFLYLDFNNLQETLGKEGTVAWYSTLSQEDFDQLLSLLESVGDSNAELIS